MYIITNYPHSDIKIPHKEVCGHFYNLFVAKLPAGSYKHAIHLLLKTIKMTLFLVYHLLCSFPGVICVEQLSTATMMLEDVQFNAPKIA